MPKQAPKPKARKAPSRTGFFISLVGLSVLLAFFLKLGFVLLLFALLPSSVAYLTDRHPYKMGFYGIACCNLAGTMPALAQLQHEPTWQNLQIMLMNAQMWLVILAAASLGWILNWMTPYAAQLFLEILHANESAQSRAAQKKLIEDWGSSITTNDD